MLGAGWAAKGSLLEGVVDDRPGPNLKIGMPGLSQPLLAILSNDSLQRPVSPRLTETGELAVERLGEGRTPWTCQSDEGLRLGGSDDAYVGEQGKRQA